MSHELIAVTSGIGELHSRLAAIAARRMRHFTGLQVVVLGANDLNRTGLSNPNHLKFRLFDLVDAENVLYFDADAFCLQSWDPRLFCNQREWIAVRGFAFDERVARLGRIYGFGDATFNGGFSICNRTHHSSALRLAEALQPADDTFHDLVNPDEIAFSTALAVLRIPIRFLDRRFNWMQYGRGNLSGRASPIIAHACDAQLRAAYLEAPPAAHDNDADDGLFSRLGGKTWRYERVGCDERPLEFRTDGTIGAGGANAERYFFGVQRDGRTELVIGSVHDETCTLTEGPDGVWRGNWSSHERMPVTLMRHRAQVIIDLLAERGLQPRSLTGVEVGVHCGESACLLLRGLPGLHLFLVDPWRVAVSEPDHWRSQSPHARQLQKSFNVWMEQASNDTSFAGDCRTLVPLASEIAARFLPDDLDFVFIDGDHSREGVQRDLEAWRPKLSRGGLLCGHDYDHPGFPGVRQAVDEFARTHNQRLRTAHDFVWYFDSS